MDKEISKIHCLGVQMEQLFTQNYEGFAKF